MTPHEILGLPPDPTDAEIKKAYRSLMKQYHPDKNKSEEAKKLVLVINAAYEILSDPVKREQYKNPDHTTADSAEDPLEAYKQEFINRRRERERAAREKKTERDKSIYYLIWLITFPILLFSCVLLLDNMLPTKVFNETPILGRQQTIYQRRRPDVLVSYIETPNFFLRVPHALHLAYPYYEPNKPPFRIEATPVFDIPRRFAVTLNGIHWEYEVNGTIHGWYSPVVWLMLITSLFNVFNTEYSKRNFSLCFLPLMFLAIVLMLMW